MIRNVNSLWLVSLIILAVMGTGIANNSSTPDFVFIQAADPQVDPNATGKPGSAVGLESNWKLAIACANKINPAFMIVTGDIIQSATNAVQTADYLRIASGLKTGISLYHTPGNHDLYQAPTPSSYAWYTSHFGPTWYSFVYRNCLFIGLDSEILIDSNGIPGKSVEEMTWLRATLAASAGLGYNHIMVFMHHALASASVTEPFSYTCNMPQPMRSELLALFHQYNVAAVFSGHYHRNSYVRDGKLEIITTSSSGAPLSTDPIGFRVVKVYPDRIEHSYQLFSELNEQAVRSCN